MGRIHKYGNQRLTGAKNKDYKQGPGRNARSGFTAMDVHVLLTVAMRMAVHLLARMSMGVEVRFFAVCLAKAPDEICQPECD